MEKQINEYITAKDILNILFDADNKLHHELATNITVEQVEEIKFIVDYYEGKFLHA